MSITTKNFITIQDKIFLFLSMSDSDTKCATQSGLCPFAGSKDGEWQPKLTSCLDYIVQELGGRSPCILPLICNGNNQESATIQLQVNRHTLNFEPISFSRWFDCMEHSPSTSLSDMYTHPTWVIVIRTATHVYCQDENTGLVQKYGRSTNVTWSGGLINSPSLLWMPLFAESCRLAKGNTLVICESAPLSTLWRNVCHAQSFDKVSRGSRRAGDGIVGLCPCPDMPSLVVMTQATAKQQLMQSTKSALLTCHFDRIILHTMHPSKLDSQLLESLHEQWPNSLRWVACLATLHVSHLAPLFHFLRLRHTEVASLPVLLDQAPISLLSMKHLFSRTCWNMKTFFIKHKTGHPKKRARHSALNSSKKAVTLHMISIVPGDEERVLLSHNRRCEHETKFYDNPEALYLTQLQDRFVMTRHLTHDVLCEHYGQEDYINGLHRLRLTQANAGLECCVCLSDIPHCATLVLPCCHTLCTICFDGMLSSTHVTKCPLCNRVVPENQEPLIWVRHRAVQPGSKTSWIKACGLDYEQIGGPHKKCHLIADKTGSTKNTGFILWDTRMSTLQQAALAVVSNVDAGIVYTDMHVLLWQDFDDPETVKNDLKSLLPNGWLE